MSLHELQDDMVRLALHVPGSFHIDHAITIHTSLRHLPQMSSQHEALCDSIHSPFALRLYVMQMFILVFSPDPLSGLVAFRLFALSHACLA